MYRTLAQCGFELGTCMRALDCVHVGADELLAELRAPTGADLGHVLSPALLDAAAHSVVALGLAHTGELGDLYLGFSTGELEVYGTLPSECLGYVRISPASSPELVRFDVVLCDTRGTVLAMVRDFTAKRVLQANETAAPAIPSAPPQARFAPAPHLATAPAPSSRPVQVSAEPDEPLDLEGFLRSELSRSLRMDPARIALDTPLSRLGVDSLLAVELLGKLSRKLSLRLAPTLLFEHRTLRAVCRALTEEQRRAGRQGSHAT